MIDSVSSGSNPRSTRVSCRTGAWSWPRDFHSTARSRVAQVVRDDLVHAPVAAASAPPRSRYVTNPRPPANVTSRSGPSRVTARAPGSRRPCALGVVGGKQLGAIHHAGHGAGLVQRWQLVIGSRRPPPGPRARPARADSALRRRDRQAVRAGSPVSRRPPRSAGLVSTGAGRR